jgi:imidazolonepropionase
MEIKDALGKYVLPSFVDSHTHLVFAKSREEEFVMRIKGKSYEEIAAAGGGILNSAAKLRAMSENELMEGAYSRLLEVMKYGTGAIEIKSGYGLTFEDEIKMLRVIQQLKNISPIEIKSAISCPPAQPRSITLSGDFLKYFLIASIYSISVVLSFTVPTGAI